MAFGRNGSIDQFLAAKKQIYDYYLELEQEARTNGKPLYAEKFRLLAKEFR